MRHWIMALAIAAVVGIPHLASAAEPVTPTPPGTIIPKPEKGVEVLRSILQQPEDQIDLARAKIAIDHLVDPSVDEAATLKTVDQWVDRVRLRIPIGATTWNKVFVVYSTLYEPGPWNDYKKFAYNFDDPFGKDVHTSMLSNYLSTRRGNCVSMPIFFAILARGVGLNVTLAVAPNHLFVKVKLDNGQWKNIEATSGTTMTDQEAAQQYQITAAALENGLYLRPLTMRETVVEIAEPLFRDYVDHHSPEQIMAMVDLALSYDSKGIGVRRMKSLAYDKQATVRYRSQYADPNQLSPAQIADFNALMGSYFKVYEDLQAMGWRLRTAQQDAEYMKVIQNAKAAEKGG